MTRGIREAAALVVAAIALAASGCAGTSKSSTNSASAAPASARSSVSSTPNTTAPASGSPEAVTLSAKRSKLGVVLAAGPKRKTVYLFEGDTGSTSTCSGSCASVWPPVSGTATATAGANPSDIGTITRSDGTKQVTYKGHPLYFFARDGDAGDSYGEGLKSFGASWYVLAPSGKKVDNS